MIISSKFCLSHTGLAAKMEASEIPGQSCYCDRADLSHSHCVARARRRDRSLLRKSGDMLRAVATNHTIWLG